MKSPILGIFILLMTLYLAGCDRQGDGVINATDNDIIVSMNLVDGQRINDVLKPRYGMPLAGNVHTFSSVQVKVGIKVIIMEQGELEYIRSLLPKRAHISLVVYKESLFPLIDPPIWEEKQLSREYLDQQMLKYQKLK